MNNLTSEVNAHGIKIVTHELNEEMGNQNFSPKKDDGTPVEQDEKVQKVIIPAEMNKLQASYNLLQQFKEEETIRSYKRTYNNFFVNDFMVAMNAMVVKWFGMSHVSPYTTEGKRAANDYIQFPVGFDNAGKVKNEKGYIGSILAPVWENAIIDIYPQGHVVVAAKLKFEKKVQLFLSEVEEYIKNNSVVKGSCTSLKEAYGGLMAEPIVVKENKKIVLSEKTERIIANLIIPGLADTAKTSLLFTGDFGTGKTETALRVGKVGSEKHGRTFFYLHNCDMLGALIPYLKNYSHCTTFAEDVDQISAGDRSSRMNDLLNQIDGNELKNVDCTFIFTTNEHDKIHPAMRRPGRIDQVVHFDYCDKQSVAKIYAVHAEGMPGSETVDYEKAAEATPENLQGAVVAEIARRAVKYADKLHMGTVSTDVFLDAIASLEHQINFMRKEQKKDNSLENAMGKVFFESMMKAFPNLENGTVDGMNITTFQDSAYSGQPAK